MEEGVKRPFKIYNSQRTRLKGVVVRSLQELRGVADKTFNVGKNCRVFLDADGTEIEDDDYLSFVKDDSKLMVTASEDDWTAERSQPDSGSLHHHHQSISDSYESNESLVVDLTDAGDGIRPELVHKINVDPAFFVSLSEEDLLEITQLGIASFAHIIGQGEPEAEHYQEVCQREIDKRREYKEATALLRLYHKSQENLNEAGNSVGLKRNRTS